jgi:thiol:disulfide interchange protein/DsbC/DsbD-like thiol-disulfide interchange protein
MSFDRISLAARTFTVLLLLGCGGAAWSQWFTGAQTPVASASASVTTPHVRAELVANAPDGVVAGSTIQAGLRITHQPHWHTYWVNPGDSGLATQLDWKLPAGLVPGEIEWPLPRRLPVGPLANYGYEDTVLLPVTMRVAPDFQPAPGSGGVVLSLHAQWLVCREECIPEQGDFSLELPLKSATAVDAADFGRAAAARPQALAGEWKATVSGNELTLTATGLPAALQGRTLAVFPETPGITEPSADPRQSWAGNTWTASVLLATHRSESPAVLPLVIAATGADGSRQGWRAEVAVTGAWPATAAPAAVPAALQNALEANRATAPAPTGPAPFGTWLAALGAALIGGLLLNLMPCVFPVLAVKLLGFARHGAAPRQQRIAGLAYSAGVVLSFLALGALVLALRLAGAQLGWGFQLQSPTVVAAMAALFTLLGLNLAGVFEFGMWAPQGLAGKALRHPAADAFLSGVLAVAIASPCTAPFMGASLGLALGLPPGQALPVFAALGVGMALPYLVAAWVPAVARVLPRPGPWMDVFRRLMAFPMFATVAWLVWVLGQQSGIDGAGALLVLLVAGSAWVWSLGLAGRTRLWVGGALALVLAGAAWQLAPRAVLALPPVQATADATARWQPWSEARTLGLLAEGRPVFVDFTASWCVTCQVNERTTLADSGVLAAMDARNVALLRADWTRQDPAITQALRALGRSGVPVYVLHAPNRPPKVLTELIGRDELKTALADLPAR